VLSDKFGRGNETLGDAERLDDRRRIATFLLEFRSYLRSRHVDSILAFRELVDLVKDHVEDIKLHVKKRMKQGIDETSCEHHKSRQILLHYGVDILVLVTSNLKVLL